MKINTRAIAASVVMRVGQGHSLSECLPPALAKIKEPRDQAFIQALCFGICRHYYRLTALINALLDKPLKTKDHDIQALLLVGLYQLVDMRTPEYAAVTETVNATAALKKKWARNFVNAVLRNYQRQALTLIPTSTEETTYNHPLWFIKKVQQDWPTEWKTILLANNQHPPLSLRVNQRQYSREAYLQLLSKHHLAAELIPETESGVILSQPVEVSQLPQFAMGAVSVQDGAAQLAAELLDLKAGMRVLDACAAPGGKAAHILECDVALAELVAVDYDVARLLRVRDNLERLKLVATCLAEDVGNIDQWWDKKPFERILLDVPCSASGVIRRHPDIKLLRRAGDIPHLASEQLRLLAAVWHTLAEGGMLLYVTCSIFPEENSGVIVSFLQGQQDAVEEKIRLPWGSACVVGRQILPGMHNMDGFYFALLRKQKSNTNCQ